MPTPLRLACLTLALGMPWTACKQSRPGVVTSAVAPAAKLAPAKSAPPPPDSAIHVTGEVNRGERFLAPVGSNLFFALEPYAGNDSGWTIRLLPGTDKKSAAVDCIGAVSEPLHGSNNLSIDPPEDLSQKAGWWKSREFEFVPDNENCKAAWQLMNLVYYPSKLTDQQRAEAGEKLGNIQTSHGKFTIVDSLLKPSADTSGTGTIEWLKFEVELSSAAAPQNPPAANEPKPAADAKGIRAVDLTKFLNPHYAEVNPQLEELETECGEGQKPIQSIAPFQYGDLDGDGEEDAVFMAFTCMSGTGGVDFYGVLKLLPDGKIVSLPIQDAPKRFKGRDPYHGLRGRTRLEIHDKRLVQIFPTYPNDQACNNCSEGERKFVYRWDGHQFVLDDIIDGPPED